MSRCPGSGAAGSGLSWAAKASSAGASCCGSWLQCQVLQVRQRCYAAGCGHAKLLSATCTAAVQKRSCLLQAPAPITAITFLSDSERLVVATAINQIGVFNVPARQTTAWTKTHSAALPLRLLQMPGLITHLSANPSPRVRAQASLALHCFLAALLLAGHQAAHAALLLCANSKHIAEDFLPTLSIGHGAHADLSPAGSHPKLHMSHQPR